MARRIEFAAGIAALALDTLALLLLLLAPIAPVCQAASCPPTPFRYVSLPQANVSPAGWIYVLGLFALLLIAAYAALAEARLGTNWAAWTLWAGGILAFGGCALGAGGVGVVYLPPTLAICLAAFASISGRLRPIQSSQPNDDTPDTGPISENDARSS